MNCVECGGKTRVDNTRHSEALTTRFRVCKECNFRFKTLEIVDESTIDAYRGVV